jgi:NAD(P)-dependent dehydrogenase (short-subunit alcohol dehydrogenase family)
VGSRSEEKGRTAISAILAKHPSASISLVQLDADSDASISAAAAHITSQFGRLDVLVNNAGICIDPPRDLFPSRDTLAATFNTNVFGPTQLVSALLPLLRRAPAPRIINVSSSLGSIALHLDPARSYRDVKLAAYRMSKAALNMLTAYLHASLAGEGVKVWSYCPGYVVTDLGGEDYRKMKEGEEWCESSETSAVGIREIVEGERDGEVGTFVTKRGEAYPW